MNLLISIVVPIYNSENYIERCINSIINQSYKNLEIILVNDGSKDSSLNICKKFAEQDERITILNQSNKGVSAARNAGIEIATGKYISFIDADDTVEANYIYELVENSNNGEIDVVICSYNDIYVKGKIKDNRLKKCAYLSNEISNDYEILKEYIKYPVLKIYKLELIKKYCILFPENFTDAEDQVFNFKFFLIIQNFKFVNKSLYNYHHVNINSLSKQVTIDSFYSNLRKLCMEKLFLDRSDIKNKEQIFTNSAFRVMWKYAVLKNDNYIKFKRRLYKIKSLLYGEKYYNNKKEFIILKFLYLNIIFPIYLWYLLSYVKRRIVHE